MTIVQRVNKRLSDWANTVRADKMVDTVWREMEMIAPLLMTHGQDERRLERERVAALAEDAVRGPCCGCSDEACAAIRRVLTNFAAEIRRMGDAE